MAGNIKELIEHVKERTDIVQIIGERLELNRNNKALCPFHDDKDPSLSVDPKRQIFKCFGCGKSGDVLTFLQEFEHKSFMDAFRELAEKAGISIPEMTENDRIHIEDSRQIEEILTETAQYYHKQLTSEMKEDLTNQRGFTKDTISQFQIGYADGQLRKHLITNRGYSPDLCIKSGVLKQKDSEPIKDFFNKRIVFPNFKQGRVVHLTGRVLNDRKPKYLHLPGSIANLFNEDSLRSKEVFITEGAPDCLTALQEGYPAVGILGVRHFNNGQAEKFIHCNLIYICLDGDDAGKEGAEKVAERLSEKARIITLPDNYDLNNYFMDHNKEDFDKLVVAARDYVQFRIDQIDPAQSKPEIVRQLKSVLVHLSKLDKAIAEAYLSDTIKEHFKLTSKIIDGLRATVSEYRKENTHPKDVHINTNVEPEYTAYFDDLVDLVTHEGEIKFLIKDGNELSIMPSIEREGVLYSPPPTDRIPWMLPQGDEVLKNYKIQEDNILFNDLINYHQGISELPDEKHYIMVVAWDMHTYLIDKFQYSPILSMFAVPERGKSRTGKGITYVAHRGIHVESLREAYLLRAANDLRCSIFFDVKSLWRKAEKNNCEDLILQRFEKGVKVPRVMFPEKGAHRDVVWYDIFGPTILGTNEGIHQILDTRAITLNMPETGKQFENNVTPEGSLSLKERLVAFRARNFGRPLPEVEKPTRGRLGDILQPLYQVLQLACPQYEIEFFKLVGELELRRTNEKTDSIEGQILRVIISLGGIVKNGILSVKSITEKFNEDKSDREKTDNRRVGWKLKSLGFDTTRTSSGNSAIYWNKDKIERMRISFGVKKTPETSETPDSSESPDINPRTIKETEDSGVSEGFSRL